MTKSAAKTSRVLFNYVGRDHNQGPFRNGQVPTDLKALQIMTYFDSLNQNGPQYFGRFEGGGQEPGSYAMSFRNPAELFTKSVEAMPNGTEIRSLTRGGYGNSVVALNPQDLEKWLHLVNDQTKGRTVFKAFDYNTNLDELKHCVETVKKFGAKIEIAIPHSPEESYQSFFNKKVAEAAEFAAQYGTDLSIKRMVTGLRVDDAKRIGGIVFPLALKHGIKSVGLHAHGDVPDAAAEFLKMGIDHGVAVNTDFVHKGSGLTPNSPGTFPNIYAIGDELAKRGFNLELTPAQLKILGNIDELQRERDESYKIVRTGGAWSEKAKMEMGLPDGGESYSVEAIEKSKYSKISGMTPELSKDIFKIYYEEFRTRFAMPTSVTPGHKRIETGAIYSIEKTIDSILVKDVLDLEKITKSIKSQSYEELYGGLNPEIVDAFRNNKLPEKLTKEALKFLCAENMKTTLVQDVFKGLHQEAKDLLASASHDSKEVEDIAKKLVQNKLLPAEVLTGKGEKFCKISLVQASGEREYLESAKAPARYQACHDTISEKVKSGAKVSSVETAAIISAALTAGDTMYVDGTYHGSKPSAEGLTADEYKKASSKFLAENLVVLGAKKYDLPSPARLLELGADGYFSGSVVGDDTDRPGATIKPTEKSNLKDGAIQER